MKLLKVFIILALVAGGISLFSPQLAGAEPRVPSASAAAEAHASEDKDNVSDPAVNNSIACTKSSCPIVAKYINPLISLLTVIVGLAVVIGIIIGAIQVITSAGDPQKAASGRDHVRNAIIALVAYIFLFGFLQFLIPGGLI